MPEIQNLPPPPPCPRVHLFGLFFPSCPPCYLANPSHCQDLNAAFSVCHIFSIQHSASFPWARQTRKEWERGRNWRGDKETHSMDYTRTYTHKYAYTHAGTHCMSLCLISPAVYQGDQEFNTVKFPVDKTVFGEAGPNECWVAQRRGRRRRKNWRRWEEDDKRALRFNCLPDTFLSSLSSSPHLL